MSASKSWVHLHWVKLSAGYARDDIPSHGTSPLRSTLQSQMIDVKYPPIRAHLQEPSVNPPRSSDLSSAERSKRSPVPRIIHSDGLTRQDETLTG